MPNLLISFRRNCEMDGAVDRRARDLSRLERHVLSCRLCPRLVAHREHVRSVKTRRFADQAYWGRPLPAFGDPRARLLVVGLAPAAHGGNRTGRMFTGDRSGDWLFEALHRFGFANRPDSTGRDDGLTLNDCCVTAVARCAPPGNKPTAREIANCRDYLVRELEILDRMQVVIALGEIAFDGFIAAWKASGRSVASPRPRFAHGCEFYFRAPQKQVLLLGSFHPSQQNTFTGKLTRPMFHRVFRKARRFLWSG